MIEYLIKKVLEQKYKIFQEILDWLFRPNFYYQGHNLLHLFIEKLSRIILIFIR